MLTTNVTRPLFAAVTIVAGVALVLRRRGFQPTDSDLTDATRRRTAPPHRQRPSSPAASLQWLSPATGTFATCDRRSLARAS